MELMEIAMKAGKVIRSAQTPEQHEAVKRYRKLYQAFLNRLEEKTHPWTDYLILFFWAGLAFAGVMAILYGVSLGFID